MDHLRDIMDSLCDTPLPEMIADGKRDRFQGSDDIRGIGDRLDATERAAILDYCSAPPRVAR